MSKEQAAATKPVAPVTPDIDTSSWNEANVNLDGWYNPDVSGVLVGRAIEAFVATTAYGPQDVVKIRIAKPIVALIGKGEDAEKKTLPVGSVVGVRISMNLTILLELVANQCAVEITPKGKKPTSSGRKIWTYGVKFKGERRPLVVAPKTQEQSSGNDPDDDDGVPF